MNFAFFRRISPALVLVAAIQTGCGGGGGNGGEQQPQQSVSQATATSVGTLNGAASSAVVGTAGGTVTSADGKVTVTVPAGALQSAATISIQPITNQAHGGLGSAFRLSPEGQTFAKPVTVSFNYADADVAGSAASALGIAFQRASGVWEWAAAPVVDTAAKKVTVQATHFSDWSLVSGFRLLPYQATVGAGKTLALRVVYCYPPPTVGDDLAPLGYACKENDPELPWLVGYVDQWSVDGVLGGNSTKGTVAGDDFNATFTAPSTKPTPDTVAVSARVRNQQNGKTLIVANVKITESADYSGTVDFQNAYASGKATVNWIKLGEVEGVPMYKASGTMEFTTNVEGCDPVHLSLPLVSNSDLSLGAYKMGVYPDGMGPYSRQYYFHLVANEPESVTLMCGAAPKVPMVFPTSMLTSVAVGAVGACTGSPPTYSDRRQLAGTWSCAVSQTSATWSFNAP